MSPNSLRVRLDLDLKTGLKEKNEIVVGVLRLLKAAVQRLEIDRKTTLDEPDLIRLIQKEMNKRVDAMKQFSAGGREDLAKREADELNILKAYVPAPMDETALQAMVDAVMNELSAHSIKDMGAVVKTVLERAQGKADGGRVAAMVKSKLQS